MKIPVKLLTLLLTLTSLLCCKAQAAEPLGSSYFEAVSNGTSIYYILKDFKDEKWDFSIFHANSSEPQYPLLLSKYPDSPRFFISHDSKALAFFNDGTCLAYNNIGQKSTYQSLPLNYLPLDAVADQNSVYLLASQNGIYNILTLKDNQWQTYSTLSKDISDTLITPKIFYYNNQVYITGLTTAGNLLCDAVTPDGVEHLNISLDENRRLISIDSIIKVNKTTVFIIRTDSYKPGFIAVKFINNIFTGKVNLPTQDLPDIQTRKYSFISCKTDLMLAVYSEKKIHLQKFDLNGSIIDQPIATYSLNTEDSIDNIYLQIIGYLATIIVAGTIVIKFKKAIAGGPVPKSAIGRPCSITLRLPALIVDMLCMSFLMDGFLFILDKIHLINKEQFLRSLEQMPLQLNATGAINIDIHTIMILMGSLYTVMLIYFTLFEWRLSLTPGKALFGIKVVDYNTLAPIKEQAFLRILVRNIFRILELLSFATLITVPLIGVIMMLSPRKQRPGDMVANTTVVMTRQMNNPTGQNIDHQA